MPDDLPQAAAMPDDLPQAAAMPDDLPQAAATARLDRIRTRFERLKALEAEHGFGVHLADGVALESVPGIPDGAREVFQIIDRIEGSLFRFQRPPEVGDPAALRKLPDNPHDPLGPALSIGCELHSIPTRLRAEIDGGEAILLDLTDGDVYHIQPDDYVFLYTHPEQDVDIHVFAPDIVTFFDEYVLGGKYPRLVETILGPGVLQRRVNRGRFRGEYEDTWLRLLATAGLLSEPVPSVAPPA